MFKTGEPCRQIFSGKFSQRDGKKVFNELLFLCEKSLYLLKDTGGIIQMRRLEVDPSCICVYPVSGGGNSVAFGPGPVPNSSSAGGHNFLIASMDCTIQVYNDFNLMWAAKCPSVPVQMAVCDIGLHKGLILTIDDVGNLRLSYLGTKPPLNTVSSHSRELDYDKVDAEHKMLLQVIRDAQSENKTEPQEKLIIRSQVGKVIDSSNQIIPSSLPSDVCRIPTMTSAADEGPLVRIHVRIFISFSGTRAVTNVSLSVSSPEFIHVVPSNIHLESISGARATPTIVFFDFFATKTVAPTNLEAQVIASYTAANGDPQVITHIIRLPMIIACSIKAPTKVAAHKVVFDTENVVAEPLTDLFADFLLSNREMGVDVSEILGASATHKIGFQFWFSETMKKTNADGRSSMYQLPATVSIHVSKTAGRYRVQSDSLQAMAFIAIELENRLSLALSCPVEAKVNSITSMDFPQTLRGSDQSLVQFTDPLPLPEYFATVEEHFVSRSKLNDLLSQLNDSSHQYRVIQKRILVRFKDKNPIPLGGLDIIMRQTYATIISLSDQVQEMQLKVKVAAAGIEIMSRLLCLLAALRFGLSRSERKLFETYMCPNFQEGIEQGWEEAVDASMTFLLKTQLAKNIKETATLSPTIIEIPSDIETFKKHLGMVLDRLSKGFHLKTHDFGGEK